MKSQQIHSKTASNVFNRFLEIYQEATDLYGLIHARFILSPKGYQDDFCSSAYEIETQVWQ